MNNSGRPQTRENTQKGSARFSDKKSRISSQSEISKSRNSSPRKSLRPLDFPQPVRGRSRIESMQKAMIGNNSTPSSFDYTPNYDYKYNKGNGNSFSKTKRFYEKKYITPSPADYQNVVLNESQSPRKSSDISLVRSNKTSPRKESFGRSKRFSESISQAPSVWSYDIESAWKQLTKKEARAVFPRSKRESPSRSTSPDPAKYAPELLLIELPGRQNNKSRESIRSTNSSPRKLDKARNQSPSRNNQRASISPFKDVRRYSLSHSPQSRHKLEPAFSFGYSPKLKSTASIIPGPKYDSHIAKDHVSKANNTGSFPKSYRNLHQQLLINTPSPQNYNVESSSKFLFKKPANILFSKDKRKLSETSTITIGPGAYNIDSPHNSKFTRDPQPVFSKSIREVNKMKKNDYPSVFDYSPNYSVFDKKRSAIIYLTG